MVEAGCAGVMDVHEAAAAAAREVGVKMKEGEVRIKGK